MARLYCLVRPRAGAAATSPWTHRSICPRSIVASRHGPLGSCIVRPSTGSLPATSRRPVIMSRSHATAITALGRRSRITRRASWPRVATNEQRVVDVDRGVLHPVAAPEQTGHERRVVHHLKEWPPFEQALGEQV